MELYDLSQPVAENITVDVDKGRIDTGKKTLAIQQGEHDSRLIQASLVKEGNPVNLENSNVYFLTFSKGIDKVPSLTKCEIFDAKNGLVKVYVKDYMSRHGGLVEAEFVRIGTDKSRLPFAKFPLNVDESLSVDESIENSEPLSALVEALADVAMWDSQFEQKYQGLESMYAQELTETKQKVENYKTSSEQEFVNLKEDINQTNAQLSEKQKQIYSSRKPIASQFCFQEFKGNEITSDNSCRKLQGGVINEGHLIYANVNDDDTKCELIKRDLSTFSIVQQNIIENHLAHANDLACDGEYLYSASGFNINKVDLNTLTYHSSFEINTPLTIQGLDFHNGKFYLKATDNQTIYVCDSNFTLLDTIVLESTPQALYSQGICVTDDGVYDVRGLPATVYHYDFSGELLTSFELLKIADIFKTGELEFLAKNGTNFYFGGFMFTGRTSFNLNTFGKFSLAKPVSSNNPYARNSNTGVISIFVDGVNGTDTGDGSESKPFKHILQAVPLLDGQLIQRIRVVAGTFENIEIQHKTFTLYANGNTINGLRLFECNAHIHQLNCNSGQITEYALSIENSDVILDTRCNISGDKPVYVSNGNLHVSSNSLITTNGKYKVYLSNATTNVVNYVNGEKGSLLVSKNPILENTKLDNTSGYTGSQGLGVSNLVSGSITLSPTVPYTSIRGRVEFLGNNFDFTASISTGGSNSRTFSVALSGVDGSNYYTGVYGVKIDNNTFTVVTNSIYNHTTNTLTTDVLTLQEKFQPRLTAITFS